MADSHEAKQRVDAYVDLLGEEIGYADRLAPLRAYLTGLLLPGERKSVEPMAARVDPLHVRARHQSMHHFVANAPWDESDVLLAAVDHALVHMERHAPVAAWVVDDTGIPKKGRHSVGVGRQYCGVLGKQDNCQVAVSVSLVNAVASVPAAYRLYLPQAWARDADRRATAGVPSDIVFQEKWRIALAQIRHLREDEDMPPAPVVADAGYGDTTEFRDALRAMGVTYAVAIKSATTLWPPGKGPKLPTSSPGARGRPRTRLMRDVDHQPVPAGELASALPKKAWKAITWREGTKGRMRARFAAVRVRAAHRDERRTEPRPEEWLLAEWPRGAAEPTDFWLLSVPKSVKLQDLVRLVKLRWRIERDYQELKDEIGLDHYEGRSWRGFHHHGVLCIAAYAFLIAERARLSPLEIAPSSTRLEYPTITDHEDLPPRAQRHNPASITSRRIATARALLRALPYCVACRLAPHL